MAKTRYNQSKICSVIATAPTVFSSVLGTADVPWVEERRQSPVKTCDKQTLHRVCGTGRGCPIHAYPL